MVLGTICPRNPAHDRSRHASAPKGRGVPASRSAGSKQVTAESGGDARVRSGSAPSGGEPGGKRRRGFLRPLIALAAAAAIGAGAYFGLQGSGGGDQVSSQESRVLQQQYTAMLAGGGMEVDMVGADELDQALASMPISDEQRAEVDRKVQSGHMRLAWLTLWDTHAEDGDVLRVESDRALPIEVTALNSPTTLAIPFPASGTVKVTGVVDGGGGITIGMKSGAAEITWPTMQPGDTLDLPVTPGL